MPTTPSLFRVLVQQKHWNKYITFCAQYDKAAARVDRTLVGTWPSRGQFHRWLAGQLVGLPYSDHCRVLEHMFPEWTATDLFAPCPEDLLTGPTGNSQLRLNPDLTANASPAGRGPLADLSAVFTSRSEFASEMPPHALFDGARDIRAAGLSLNMLCQHYPDNGMRALIEGGTTIRCLFLDPESTAMKTREHEEGYPEGQLATLTALNIQILTQRVRDRLSDEARDRLKIAVYDETVRFNITIADDTCVVQPYLPDARGVDSPTLVLCRDLVPTGGLFSVFEQVFASLWERSTPR
ncbi:MAG TPA: DUF5919 domain-containing protein [Mycobacteriales bacterium]